VLPKSYERRRCASAAATLITLGSTFGEHATTALDKIPLLAAHTISGFKPEMGTYGIEDNVNCFSGNLGRRGNPYDSAIGFVPSTGFIIQPPLYLLELRQMKLVFVLLCPRFGSL